MATPKWEQDARRQEVLWALAETNLRRADAYVGAQAPHVPAPMECDECEGTGRVPAFGTGELSGGYADVCDVCNGAGVVEGDAE